MTAHIPILLLTVVAAFTAGCMEKPVSEFKEAFDFSQLATLHGQIEGMPELKQYRARDGVELSYRHYQSDSDVHAILIHGTSGHSVDLHSFAEYFSVNNITNVYAPDIRGHGPSPQRRGDIDYIGQLENDIADLITHIKKQAANSPRFIVGGHSSGGGMALRFGGGEHGHLADGYLLIAPYLGHDAPMVKKYSSGWSEASISKIIALSIFEKIGITRFHGTKVLRFNLPEQYRNGYETLEYSYRLMQGMHPENYRESLKNTKSTLLVIAGLQDEELDAKEFSSSILPFKSDANISYIESASHLGILISKPAMVEAAQWIEAN